MNAARDIIVLRTVTSFTLGGPTESISRDIITGPNGIFLPGNAWLKYMKCSVQVRSATGVVRIPKQWILSLTQPFGPGIQPMRDTLPGNSLLDAGNVLQTNIVSIEGGEGLPYVCQQFEEGDVLLSKCNFPDYSGYDYRISVWDTLVLNEQFIATSELAYKPIK